MLNASHFLYFQQTLSKLFSHAALFIDRMLLFKYAWCIHKDSDVCWKTSCDSQQDVLGRKINSTAPGWGLCVKVRIYFWRTSLRSRDPDGKLSANGAMSAEKVRRVMEELECSRMSGGVVWWGLSMFSMFFPKWSAVPLCLSSVFTALLHLASLRWGKAPNNSLLFFFFSKYFDPLLSSRFCQIG